MNPLLVVAYKFNDILYAVNTPEFADSDNKRLIVFYQKGTSPNSFPLQEIFDEVEYIKYYPSMLMMPLNWLHILSLGRFLKNNIIITSNVILISTKLIISRSNAKCLVEIEDGLINYRSKLSYTSSKKELALKLLGINENKILSKVTQRSYLLCPHLAVLYIGEKKQLTLSSKYLNSLNIDKLQFLQGKKIFVGQPVYKANLLELNDYNMHVNELIQLYQIDYYIPHLYSDKMENINAEILDLTRYGVTLEFVSCAFSFTIFSFYSSILYSCKLINPKVVSYLIRLKKKIIDMDVLLKNVDGIIESNF